MLMQTSFFRRTCLYLALICVGFAACRDTERPAEGYISVNGKKLWYRVFGSGNATPLVMMHGGPGFPSYYLTPLAKQLSSERKVILFDQIGCGRSELTTDTAFMSIRSHMQQVDSLLAYLGINEYYLYGHSYGTMLATDYYLSKPKGIKALILASPCISVRKWVEDANTLIDLLPDTTKDQIIKYIRREKTDSLQLDRAVNTYYDTYYNRKLPISSGLDSAIKYTGNAMYEYMWGKFDFECPGTLKNYDRVNDLSRISVPVLFTCGEFDAARPVTVAGYSQHVPGSVFVVVPNAGHETMDDNMAVDYITVRGFLSSNDKKQ